MVAQVRGALESGELKCSKRKVAEALSLSLEEVDRCSSIAGAGRAGAGQQSSLPSSCRAGVNPAPVEPDKTLIGLLSEGGEPVIQVACMDFQPVPVGIQQIE